MKKGNTTSPNPLSDFDRLQRLIEAQLRQMAQRGYTPPTDNAAPQGWYRRFRRILGR